MQIGQRCDSNILPSVSEENIVIVLQVSSEFESCCGFPDTVGAIDGSLFRIERPFEFDGQDSHYINPFHCDLS